MAKTSKLAKNEQRRELVARLAPKRTQLKAIIKNPKNGTDAAHQLFDVLLSREVQEAELVETFRRPTRSDWVCWSTISPASRTAAG